MDKVCDESFAAAIAAANAAYARGGADNRVNALTAALAVLQNAQFAAYAALEEERAAAAAAAKGIC